MHTLTHTNAQVLTQVNKSPKRLNMFQHGFNRSQHKSDLSQQNQYESKTGLDHEKQAR